MYIYIYYIYQYQISDETCGTLIVFDRRLIPRVTDVAAACGARSNGLKECHVFDGSRPLSFIVSQVKWCLSTTPGIFGGRPCHHLVIHLCLCKYNIIYYNILYTIL